MALFYGLSFFLIVRPAPPAMTTSRRVGARTSAERLTGASASSRVKTPPDGSEARSSSGASTTATTALGATAAATTSFDVDGDGGGGGGGDGPEPRRGAAPRGSCPPALVVQITAIASLGGILFGYDLGVIACALPQLAAAFDLSRQQQEISVSILYLGGGIGAAVGGSLCDAYGRKRAIVLCDVVFGIGGLVLYAAPNFAGIVAGRIIVGFAIALSGIADVTYLHEIAPVQFRGAIVSVNEACIALGFLLAFAVGSALSAEGNTDGWRVMFGVSGVVATVQFIGMLTMPESPKWLAERGRHEESDIARRQLQSDSVLYQPSSLLLPGNLVASYQSASPSSPRTATADDYRAPSPPSEFASPLPLSVRHGRLDRMCYYCCQMGDLFQHFHDFVGSLFTNFRRQAHIALFLAVTQQLCGQASVLSYAPLIFAAASKADTSSTSASAQGWATLSIGLVKFAVTVVVIWKIEAIGRRFLLLFGMGIIALGLLLLAISFAETAVAAADVEKEVISSGLNLALPGVLLVVCGYSMSFGPLTWLLTSELFPTEIRGRALGFSTIVTYGCAAVVTYTFLSAQAWVGACAVFSFYLLITCCGLVFAWFAIPDTGGKNPDEIEADLDSMRWWQGKRSITYVRDEQDDNHFAAADRSIIEII